MKTPKHPLKKYPKNTTLDKVFRGGEHKKPISVCVHGEVGYRDLELVIKRSILIISRLSKCLVEMEEKFSDARDSVDYITKRADYHIKARNALISRLEKQLDKKIKNGRLN